MDRLQSLVTRNLADVRERIAKAAESTGRAPSEITLVGITKYVTPREIAALVDAGCTHLGESRPQQLWQRVEECQSLASTLQWHLVGHMQRNKVSRTLQYNPLMHGVDSERLLAALDSEAAKQGIRPSVLIEVNCSGEAAKHGFSPDEVRRLVDSLGEYPQLDIRGLMTMAAHDAPTAAAASTFASLRHLRNEVAPLLPPTITLPELSMGMSGDFEIAIAEGATMVRVGSALWEGVV
jgi:PLP dependent protein